MPKEKEEPDFDRIGNKIYFISNNHTRIENGHTIQADNYGALRGISILKEENPKRYIVSLHLLDDSLSNWGDKVQMAPKPMKIIEEDDNKITLQGFGSDNFGNSFSDYGIELSYDKDTLTEITLKMHDRNIDIIYHQKTKSKQKTKPQIQVFERAFGRERENISKGKRTFANVSEGIDAGYLPFYQDAIENYNSKKLLSALQNINKVITKSDISDWRYYAFRANIYEDLKKYNEAISDYTQAIEHTDTDIHVYALYHQIGFCHISQGSNAKAVEFYSYAIELKNEHPNSELYPDREGMEMGVMIGILFQKMYNNRANSFLNLNKLLEAFEDCKKALSYDENYSNPYLLLSQIYNKTGEDSKSIECLKIAAQLGNKNAPMILQRLGLV